jgi:hypothetical protein
VALAAVIGARIEPRSHSLYQGTPGETLNFSLTRFICVRKVLATFLNPSIRPVETQSCR